MKRRHIFSLVTSVALLATGISHAEEAAPNPASTFEDCLKKALPEAGYYNLLTPKILSLPRGRTQRALEASAQREDAPSRQGKFFTTITLRQENSGIVLEAAASQRFIEGMPGISMPSGFAAAKGMIQRAQEKCEAPPSG